MQNANFTFKATSFRKLSFISQLPEFVIGRSVFFSPCVAYVSLKPSNHNFFCWIILHTYHFNAKYHFWIFFKAVRIQHKKIFHQFKKLFYNVWIVSSLHNIGTLLTVFTFIFYLCPCNLTRLSPIPIILYLKELCWNKI